MPILTPTPSSLTRAMALGATGVNDGRCSASGRPRAKDHMTSRDDPEQIPAGDGSGFARRAFLRGK